MSDFSFRKIVPLQLLVCRFYFDLSFKQVSSAVCHLQGFEHAFMKSLIRFRNVQDLVIRVSVRKGRGISKIPGYHILRWTVIFSCAQTNFWASILKSSTGYFWSDNFSLYYIANNFFLLFSRANNFNKLSPPLGSFLIADHLLW